MFSRPPVCQRCPFWGTKHSLEAEIAIFSLVLCLSCPLAVPAPRCAYTPPRALTFQPHCQSFKFSLRGGVKQSTAQPCVGCLHTRETGSCCNGGQTTGVMVARVKEESELHAGNKEKIPVVGEHCEQHHEAQMARLWEGERRSSQSSHGSLLRQNPHP